MRAKKRVELEKDELEAEYDDLQRKKVCRGTPYPPLPGSRMLHRCRNHCHDTVLTPMYDFFINNRPTGGHV